MFTSQPPRLPKPALTNTPKPIHTARPLIPYSKATATTLRTLASSTRTRLATMPGITVLTSAPKIHLTHQTQRAVNTTSMEDTSSSGDTTAFSIPILMIFGTIFLCAIICAIGSCRYWSQRQARRDAANSAQNDIYTQRREAFSRRRAAIARASTISNVDLERGSQQQQQQHQPPPAYGDVVPRYESLSRTQVPGQEHWPLQELRPSRRVMTDPIPEGAQGYGSTWAAPWTVAEGARKE